MFNIVIFSSDSVYSYKLLKGLVESNSEDIKLIYVSKSFRRQKSKKFIIRKLLNGLGFRYYLFSLSQKIRIRVEKKSVRDLAKKHNIPVEDVVNINDDSVISTLNDINPDLFISGYFDQIVKKKILDIPSFGTINVHPSMLPKYRGVKPIFWVLRNDESETGVTVHMMDEGIDTGDIVIQGNYEIKPDDTFNSLMMRLTEEASELLVTAVSSIKNNEYSLKKQDDLLASYYGQPTKEDLAEFLKSGKRFY